MFFVLSILCQKQYAGNEPNTVGAKAYGLAGTSILFSDFWSAENNPAGLGFLKQWGAGLSYENQFLEKELANKSAVFSFPMAKGAFGVSFNQFGFSNFNETKFGLSYGKQLGKSLAMGIQMNHLSTHIGEGYGNQSTISGNLGLMAKITDDISMAAMIINPSRTKRAEFDDERYPSILKLGISYNYSEKVIAYSEIVKDIDFDTDLKVAIEYKIIQGLDLRLGYATNPSLSSFGFGVDLHQFHLDFASGFDSNLGFSPQVSLSYIPSLTTSKK